MLQVLSKLLGSSHKLPLRDPLLNILHLTLQHVQLEHLIQLLSPLAGRQVLEAGVQFVHLGLFHCDGFTGKTSRDDKDKGCAQSL